MVCVARPGVRVRVCRAPQARPGAASDRPARPGVLGRHGVGASAPLAPARSPPASSSARAARVAGGAQAGGVWLGGLDVVKRSDLAPQPRVRVHTGRRSAIDDCRTCTRPLTCSPCRRSAGARPARRRRGGGGRVAGHRLRRRRHPGSRRRPTPASPSRPAMSGRCARAWARSSASRHGAGSWASRCAPMPNASSTPRSTCAACST